MTLIPKNIGSLIPNIKTRVSFKVMAHMRIVIKLGSKSEYFVISDFHSYFLTLVDGKRSYFEIISALKSWRRHEPELGKFPAAEIGPLTIKVAEELQQLGVIRVRS